MEFNKMYKKVKYIVRKCEKEYYIQLWEKDDWGTRRSANSV